MIAGLALVFILYGLVITGPRATLEGLLSILAARDMLMTDYMVLGGIGGAFLNAGLLTLIAVGVYWRAGAPVGGSSVACLFLLLGFALFGKNILNVWPILGGVYLYARFKSEPFAAHLNTAFFGCALAPVISEILFSSAHGLLFGGVLALATGVLLGFVLPPIAAWLFRAHEGYSLYNMGFTGGMVGTSVVAAYISFGFVPEPVFLWETEATPVLAPFLTIVFLGFVAAGLVVDRWRALRLGDLHVLSGQAPSDFSRMVGDGPVLVSMGLMGLGSTAYVLAVGGDLNGPTVGAILSVVGFGAFGKHLMNCMPIVAGALLITLLKGEDPATPGVLLAALFSTSLAPIAGRFGWHWGILAGAIHVTVAQTVGVLHAGLNLYNNGFAAGIVATLVSAVILSLRRDPDDHDKTMP